MFNWSVRTCSETKPYTTYYFVLYVDAYNFLQQCLESDGYACLLPYKG